MRKAHLSGWGNYPVSIAMTCRPERISRLRFEDSAVIARGLGKSYGDASLNAGHEVVLMERLNRFLGFDDKTGLLRAEAGVTFEEILNIFVPRGWFLPVTPGTKFVTLGGCLAADVHGKNHHVDGTISRFVREIEILLANGTKKRCSPEVDSDIFWSAMGGMGLTGIITEASFQLIPIETAYMHVQNQPAENLDAALRLFESQTPEDRYSVAWIDCLAKGKQFGRSIVMTGRHANAQELASEKEPRLHVPPSRGYALPVCLPGWALNYWSVKLFNHLYYRAKTRLSAPLIVDYDSYFYPLDSIANWNKMYGKRGFVQYQVVFPTETSARGLTALLEKVAGSRRASFLAVLKRFGPEGLGHLSFPKAGYTLALDMPVADDRIFPFLDKLDDLVIKFGGRVYLAKDARLKPDAFRVMYPRAREWEIVKKRVDPNGLFSSDLSRRLKLGGPS